jgi:hypothetical protein
MTDNIFQKFTVAAASVALSFTVVKSSPPRAATITYDFTTNLKSGYFLTIASELGIPDEQEPVSGFFSYDDSTLTGTGVERLGKSEGLVASLNSPFGTVSPLESPELNIPFFVTFNNRELVGLTGFFPTVPFSSSSPNFEIFRINEQQVSNDYSVRLSPFKTVSGSLSGNVQYSLQDVDGTPTPVPEPTTALGTCLFGLAGLVKLVKQKKLVQTKPQDSV